MISQFLYGMCELKFMNFKIVLYSKVQTAGFWKVSDFKPVDCTDASALFAGVRLCEDTRIQGIFLEKKELSCIFLSQSLHWSPKVFMIMT